MMRADVRFIHVDQDRRTFLLLLQCDSIPIDEPTYEGIPIAGWLVGESFPAVLIAECVQPQVDGAPMETNVQLLIEGITECRAGLIDILIRHLLEVVVYQQLGGE